MSKAVRGVTCRRNFWRNNTASIDDIVNIRQIPPRRRLPRRHQCFSTIITRSHALAPLFHTEWDDALLVTADAGGDTVNYSHRHFADGVLTTIYGGEECLLAAADRQSGACLL